MVQTSLQRRFAVLRRILPGPVTRGLRSFATAFLMPVLYSWRTGHFRSSFHQRSVSRVGEPLPWYTYPCIHFLQFRSYQDRRILEFGAGQSTLWWGHRAGRVVALEGDAEWISMLRDSCPPTVDIREVSIRDAESCVRSVNEVLVSEEKSGFDVVVIDGLWREWLFDIAVQMVAEDGVIICDNAEGYGVQEAFAGRDFLRVDFFGNAPGVVLPHCTSIFFRPQAFLFSPRHPVPVIAHEL